MSDKWPTLSPREYKNWNGAGINSCDEFIRTCQILRSCGRSALVRDCTMYLH